MGRTSSLHPQNPGLLHTFISLTSNQVKSKGNALGHIRFGNREIEIQTDLDLVSLSLLTSPLFPSGSLDISQ
jgi:hypothetical protein